MLIALRQTVELENDFRIGLTNDLARNEIEEAVVQTAPYACFPAAWAAVKTLSELVADDWSSSSADEVMFRCCVLPGRGHETVIGVG